MRSRRLSELVPTAAGAVVEGIWTGALGALVTGGPGAAYAAGAAAGVFSGAVLAYRTGGGREPSRRARATAVGLTLGVAAAFFAAERGWSPPRPAFAALGALVYAALLVYLGITLGRDAVSADAAFRRAVRSFALLCGLLAVAAVAGAAPAWATAAVVAAILAGTLSVASARARSLDAVEGVQHGATWRWLLTVTGVLLLVVAIGLMLSLALRVDVLLWSLAVAGRLVQYLLSLLGFVLGWAGAGLVRALSWLFGQLDLHPLPEVEPPQGAAPHVQALPRTPRSGAWGAARLAATVAGAALAVTVPLLVVALALRRARGGRTGAVEEERETVLTLREAGAGAAAAVRRRFARLVPRRKQAATPAELVRREYEGLERRLARAGHPRPSATTVRDHLGDLAGLSTGEEPVAAEIARLYEIARYSTHAIDADTAGRFGDLARAFPVPGPTSG